MKKFIFLAIVLVLTGCSASIGTPPATTTTYTTTPAVTETTYATPVEKTTTVTSY